MKKCLRLIIEGTINKNLLTDFIQISAQKLQLEGSAQIIGSNELRLIVCGRKDSVDEFLDVLYGGHDKWVPDTIEIEPFVTTSNYRGIFRIIE